MVENTQLEVKFPSVTDKKVTVDFKGSVVTSDEGLQRSIIFMRLAPVAFYLYYDYI